MIENMKKNNFESIKTYSEFYEDGTTMYKFSVIKVNDEEIKNGECKKYYPNGKLAYEGLYSCGSKEGKWIYYYNTGKIKAIQYYKEGKLLKTENFNEKITTFSEND